MRPRSPRPRQRLRGETHPAATDELRRCHLNGSPSAVNGSLVGAHVAGLLPLRVARGAPDAQRPSATTIRIDRYLQSTILFSKMSATRLGSLRERHSRGAPAARGFTPRTGFGGLVSVRRHCLPPSLRERTSDAPSPRGLPGDHYRYAAASLGVGPRIRPPSVEDGDSGSNPTAQAFPASRVNVSRCSEPGATFPPPPRNARSTTGPDDPDPSGETTMVLQCQPTLSTTCVLRPACLPPTTLLPARDPSAAVPLSPTGLFPAQPVGGVLRSPPRTGDSSLRQEPSRAPTSEASTPVVVEPSFAPLGLCGALRPDLGSRLSGLERPEPGAFHH
jgi:hypothetical protein